MGDHARQMISRIEHGQSTASVESLCAAARVLDVSADYLYGLTDDPTPSVALARDLADARAIISGEQDAVPDSVRHVTVVELASAAGHGAVVDSEQVTGRIAFRRSWLTRHGITADQCSVIRVVGESMEPTLPDGASILVDRNRRRRRVDHIFVVRTGDGLIVKRLGKTTAGAWRLLSDNPDKAAWPTLPWPDTAEVIGEVKWAARTFE